MWKVGEEWKEKELRNVEEEVKGRGRVEGGGIVEVRGWVV